MADHAFDPSREIRTLALLEWLGSSRLFERLGAEEVSHLLVGHDRVVRDLLSPFDGREIEKTRRFLLLFERPLDAVGFSLAYHRAVADLGVELDQTLAGRVGIHLGEVLLWENSAQDRALGAKALEVEGPARTTVARVLSLAVGGQALLSRPTAELAQRAAVGARPLAEGMRWEDHGAYRFTGPDEVLDIFEVGLESTAPFTAPTTSRAADAHGTGSVARHGAHSWKPVANEPIPHRPHWTLERPLEESTYGEVWLAKHKKTGDRQTFRFCIRAEDLPRMRRQLEVVRHVKMTLAGRDVAVLTRDAQLEEVPYFLASEYAEGRTLTAWAEHRGGVEKLTVGERLEVAAQLAEGLAELHGAGVVAGGVQPRSVLVRESEGMVEQVLVGDLSQAHLLTGDNSTEDSEPTVRSDLYGLGVLLYQLIVGNLERGPGLLWPRDVDDTGLREQIALLMDRRSPSDTVDLGALARRLRSKEGPGEGGEPQRGGAESVATRDGVHHRWWTLVVAFLLGGLLTAAVFLFLG